MLRCTDMVCRLCDLQGRQMAAKAPVLLCAELDCKSEQKRPHHRPGRGTKQRRVSSGNTLGLKQSRATGDWICERHYKLDRHRRELAVRVACDRRAAAPSRLTRRLLCAAGAQV